MDGGFLVFLFEFGRALRCNMNIFDLHRTCFQYIYVLKKYYTPLGHYRLENQVLILEFKPLFSEYFYIGSVCWRTAYSERVFAVKAFVLKFAMANRLKL